MSFTCQVNVILLTVDRIREEAFCSQQRVRQPFVRVDHGADFTLPLDQGNEGGFVPLLDYEVAAIITLAKPEDPRPIDSCAVIPHILHVSSLIIGHKWRITSQYTTSIVFSSSSEPSLIDLNGLLVNADHFPSLHEYSYTNSTTRLKPGCDCCFGSPGQFSCLTNQHLDHKYE